MKRSINFAVLVVLLLMSGHQAASAQQNLESLEPRLGIKGGVNFSNLYTNDGSDASMLAGFNLGVFGKFPVIRQISIQPEFYFTTKGAEVIYNSLFVDGTARFNLSYLEVPILFIINITDHFNVHLGPYGSFLIGGKASNVSNVNLFNFEQNIDSNDYNRFDAGLAVGVGIDVGPVGIGARYNYGLTDIGKEKTFMGVTYTVPDASNGVINFFVSVSLN